MIMLIKFIELLAIKTEKDWKSIDNVQAVPTIRVRPSISDLYLLSSRISN
jgi:hypothetical protein